MLIEDLLEEFNVVCHGWGKCMREVLGPDFFHWCFFRLPPFGSRVVRCGIDGHTSYNLIRRLLVKRDWCWRVGHDCEAGPNGGVRLTRNMLHVTCYPLHHSQK